MFLAMSFEIVRVIGIAMIVVIRIVIRIVVRLDVESWVIWERAKAAPVRDFWKRNRVTNEIDMTIVLMEPRRTRNCSRFSLPVISEPMIAAWDEPRPGKKEQIGETMIVARVGLISCFLFRFSFSIDCFGMIVLDLIEWIIVEVPKRPVRRGRRGCLMSRFRVAKPINPASAKMRMAFVLDCFSE